jgi:hypothetical protein
MIVLPSSMMAGLPVEVVVEAWPDALPLLVSYAPSGTLFTQLSQSNSSELDRAMLLAVGDPSYPEPEPERTLEPPPDYGLTVTEVVPLGTADRAGIRPGDVLLSYNGKRLERRNDLALGPVGQLNGGLVTLWRDGEVRAVEVVSGTFGTRLDGLRPTAEAFLARRQADGLLKVLSRGGAWQRLPGTRREVESIARLFSPRDVVTLLGERATESAVQGMATSGEMKNYRYITFATHGQTNPAVAMSSALILAPDAERAGPTDPEAQKADGRITAQQIAYTWELHADLVVLSACESGLGRHAEGEGYLGFAQAFFAKGVRSLVLSQWKVDDRATSLLMTRLFQNLLGKRPGLPKPMTKTEALYEAKRWLRGQTADEIDNALVALDRGVERPLAAADAANHPNSAPALKLSALRPYAHPYYWAGFILIGDPN